MRTIVGPNIGTFLYWDSIKYSLVLQVQCYSKHMAYSYTIIYRKPRILVWSFNDKLWRKYLWNNFLKANHYVRLYIMYGPSVVLLMCALVPEINYNARIPWRGTGGLPSPLKLESHHITFKSVVIVNCVK